MVKAIVFDFDGVILESAKIKTEAFADVVKDYPKNIADEFVAYHMTHMGISRHVKFQYFIEEILKEKYSESLEKELADKFSDIVFRRVMECEFVPGAYEFLERNYLKYDMYIASGTPVEELNQIIEGRKLTKYFKEAFGTPMKKEEIVGIICDKYGHNRKEMCFVGDASTDKIAAANTGLMFIGRNTEDNVEVFQDVQHTVDNLLQIEHILGEV